MKELRSKITEALISALPVTAIVYVVALLPWFDFSATTLIAPKTLRRILFNLHRFIRV